MFSKDTIPFDADIRFSVLDQQLVPFYDMDRKFHWHECLEISMVKKGSGRYYIEDRVCSVTAGDIVVINNIEPHYLEVDENGMHQMVFVFDPQLLHRTAVHDPAVLGAVQGGDGDALKIYFDRGSDFDNRITASHALYPEIVANLDSIHREFRERKDGWTGVIQARLMLISLLLYRNLRSCRMPSFAPGSKKLQLAKIQEVMNYISIHYAEECSLKQAAALAHMTPSWFSAFFKRVSGCGFVECLNRVRIEAACTQLAETDAKIITIAIDSGFPSTAHFNRIFRRLKGMTPSEYRTSR